MDDHPTCGEGLAQNSVLPGKLGELAVAMAENLEAHMRSLAFDDPNARQEYEVYVQLANEQRETAARLLATANEMAAARDLPMGRHDFTDGNKRQALAAFEKLVSVKQELLALLEQAGEQDERLLSQMRSSQSGPSMEAQA